MARPIPLAEFPAFVEKVADATVKALASGVTTAAQVLAGHIAETIMSEPKAPGPGTIRTGALARSYLDGVKYVGESRGTVTAQTTSRLVYAGIQNDGGFVEPKTRQNLAIPLSMHAARRWPRDWGRGELFLITSKRGNKILARKRGKIGIEPVYVLKPQVKIDGKQYLSRALGKAQPEIDKLIAGGLVKAFNG